jgi:hypothetical protein
MNRTAERKAQRKANRNDAKASKLQAEAEKLVSKLSAVRAEIAKVPEQPVEPKVASSSSVRKVAIQPWKHSVIFIQKPGDSAHQITFSF